MYIYSKFIRIYLFIRFSTSAHPINFNQFIVLYPHIELKIVVFSDRCAEGLKQRIHKFKSKTFILKTV